MSNLKIKKKTSISRTACVEVVVDKTYFCAEGVEITLTNEEIDKLIEELQVLRKVVF